MREIIRYVLLYRFIRHVYLSPGYHRDPIDLVIILHQGGIPYPRDDHDAVARMFVHLLDAAYDLDAFGGICVAILKSLMIHLSHRDVLYRSSRFYHRYDFSFLLIGADNFFRRDDEFRISFPPGRWGREIRSEIIIRRHS